MPVSKNMSLRYARILPQKSKHSHQRYSHSPEVWLCLKNVTVLELTV